MSNNRLRWSVDSSTFVNPPKVVIEEDGSVESDVEQSIRKDVSVFISITFLQHRFECFSNWGKQEMSAFWRFLEKLKRVDLNDVVQSGGRGLNAGFGLKKIQKHLYPSGGYIPEADGDEEFYELRVDSKRRIHGFQKGNVFHICYLDRNHRICS